MANDVTPKGRASLIRPRGGVGRPSIDIQRVAQALAGPGIDSRFWVSAGTVGTRDDDGSFSTTATVDSPGSGPPVPEAVYVDELGLVADVRLEPSGDLVTARYNGVGVGRFGSILVPLRGGDEVVVVIPDGDLNSPSIAIVALLADETAKIPTDWNNDRVLFRLNVPLEIRGPAVDIRSPNLQLNGRQVPFGSENI